MPPRVRHPDAAKVNDAFVAQRNALIQWLAGLPLEQRRQVPVIQQGAAGAILDELIGLVGLVRELDEGVASSPPPYDRDALAIVTRALASRLAVAVPGRSVELRVPPFAAVQCVAGPRHTRGKPPSVVETDPLTWLDLTTGRLTWASAVATGRISANGERSDLSPYLPFARLPPTR